ncbi:CopG family ribbon-helix-helix protein [Asticcacaulis sp. DXS10W]|uniref:CopG family ribbon-helix-helix protein n=1 Tax=Asticcacaulis currens TaxID=2984210 RepID=A0ABT5I9J4_9CAUL|nr:CopG family ribbon-helix-helix protein [Asticcacaulis currens]MDC7692855.1 CopG family ribbon-helix-helix protein [Asticcacaulis currens]
MSETETDHLARLSMSLPGSLLDSFDKMVADRGLPSRSSAMTELIRGAVAEHAERMRPDDVVAGTVTLVYASDSGMVRHRVAQKQRDYLKEVISSQHVFLENDQSLEVLLVQGPPSQLDDLCDAFRRIRGMVQVKLVTTAALLPPLHDHLAPDIAPPTSPSVAGAG